MNTESAATIIDTYPDFLKYWAGVSRKEINVQIEKWKSVYMAKYPELLRKQLDDYASMKTDWRKVAGEKIFPFLPEWLPAMAVAHENLLKSCDGIYRTAQKKLGFDGEVKFVLYAGIGCGAGWVTTYRGTPAVLFGLEKIAECKWHAPPSLPGLIAHELGHIVHFHLRKKHGCVRGKGPYWTLYTEGFAQRCEHVILGKETWHEAGDINDKNWLSWCRRNKSWLANKFVELVKKGKSVNSFFGDWFAVKGRKQCGYYLGHEIIRLLEKNFTLNEIALFSDVDTRFESILKKNIIA